MNPIYLEAIVVVLGIALLMVESFVPRGAGRQWIAYGGIAGLAGVFALTFFAPAGAIDAGAPYAAFYTADGLAIFFKQFALVATILFLVMGIEYGPIVERFVPGDGRGAGLGEFFSIPILTCAGLMWLVSAKDFVLIFVAVELVTISFYVLVAYMRRSTTSLEAGTKYLILGALSTGFLVYGITWIFGITGQTNLDAIREVLPGLDASQLPALMFGLALVLVALGFKVAAAPFQFWVPDVYQGAPTPVAAYLSVASKAAGFVVLVRVLEPFFVLPALQDRLVLVLAWVAAATLVYGNLAAMVQTNFKRLLAYSSIAHAGYLLMAVASVGAALAGSAIAFYLTAYLVMTYLAFLVLALVSRDLGGDDLSAFNGLGKRSPWLAGALVIAMVSLAGIPFTAGFIGKFLIFEVALTRGLYWLVAVGVVTVASGFYYYLKVVRAMYWQPARDDGAEIRVSLPSRVALFALALLVFALGIYPQPILALF